MNKMKLIILTLSAGILTNCATAVCDKVELPVLPDIKYKKVTVIELQCITEKTYQKLRYNDTSCKSRVKTLNSIIDETNK